MPALIELAIKRLARDEPLDMLYTLPVTFWQLQSSALEILFRQINCILAASFNSFIK